MEPIKGGRYTKAQCKKVPELKKKFLEEFEKNYGFYGHTCRKVPIDPDTIRRWKRQDEEFAKSVEEVEVISCEKMAFQLVRIGMGVAKGDMKAISKVLDFKGHSIGWVGKRTKFKSPVKIKCDTINDIDESMGKIIEQVEEGNLAYDNAKSLTDLLVQKKEIIFVNDVAKKLEDLEQRLEAKENE